MHGIGILYDKEGFGFNGVFEEGERRYGRLVSREGEVFLG